MRAGYSPKTAEAQGSRLLRNAEVAAFVAEGKAKQLERADLTAARVLEEYRRLAFIDARSFWTERGDLKPISELTAEQGSALAGFEAIIKNAKAGDGETDTVHKIKFWDKTKALDSLAKHFGLLIDRVEHAGELVIRHEMAG